MKNLENRENLDAMENEYMDYLHELENEIDDDNFDSLLIEMQNQEMKYCCPTCRQEIFQDAILQEIGGTNI